MVEYADFIIKFVEMWIKETKANNFPKFGKASFAKMAWASLALGGIFSMAIIGLSQNKSVQASSNDPATLCYDINGSTPLYGSGNSGQVDFDASPDFQYQACAHNQGSGGLYPLKGWMWNSNLGWVSASCQAGDNLGISCGATNYASYVEPQSGKLKGYFWGDGLGYLALSCENVSGGCSAANGNFGVQVETSGPDAGKVLAGNGYAWSDNVGWVDLAGMEMPWITQLEKYELAPYPAPPGWNRSLAGQAGDPLAGRIYAYISPDPADFNLNSNNLKAIAADGSSKYQIHLLAQDKNGNPIDPAIMSVQLDKFDNVAMDQLNGTGGAVNWGSFRQVGNEMVAEISSIAPTSNMNGADLDGDGTADCSFAVDPKSGAQNHTVEACDSNGDRFKAMLNSDTPLKLTITDNSNPSLPIVHQFDVPLYGEKELKFAPAFHVNFLSMDPTVQNPDLVAYRGSWRQLYYKIRDLGLPTTAELKFEVSADDANLDLVALQSNNAEDASKESPVATQTIDTYSVPSDDLAAGEGIFFVQPTLFSPNGSAAPLINDPRVKGIVSYTLNGQNVKYFTNGLPWDEGDVLNTGILVSGGSVAVRGAVTVNNTLDLRSLTNIGTNETRTSLLRNVSRLFGGVEKPRKIERGGYDLTDSFDYQNPLNDSVKVLKDNSVIYVPGDLNINQSGWWTGNKTIVVEGGDLTINTDMIGQTGQQLGLIVLRNEAGKGGNVYLHPDVQNLIGINIYADGAVFSFDPTANPRTSANGEPIFSTTCNAGINNQLYIKGSISSQNTIGGADRTPVLLGNGIALGIGSSTNEQKDRAKKYDWNYLRCFTKIPKLDGNGHPIINPTTGLPEFKGSGNESLVLNPYGIYTWAPIVIDYQAPDIQKLPLFGNSR